MKEPSRLFSEVEELFPVHSSGIVRLPELIGVPFTRRVRAIVDHPHFQRLRKVRQLSLAYLVYPGAVHTRFEHSLGVFETAARYLSALLTNASSHFISRQITRSDIDSLLLAALLHDIGHYPFAHLLEDLYGEVADHISLVRSFLTGEIGSHYEVLALPPGAPSLGDLAAKHWPEARLDDICYFVSGQTGADPYPEENRAVKALLRSILDGPVDADKMDYLYRDSIHCGVPYGRFIDRDRFFQALTASPARPDTIAISEKGRIGVELFAYARSAMYSEVYWHHSSRAITAMLNFALRDLTAGPAPMERQTLMNFLFARSDEEIVEWLSLHGGDICRDIMRLIHERRLYKRLLVIQKPVHPSLFDMLDRIKWEPGFRFDRLQEHFVERINTSGIFSFPGFNSLRPHDLLIDVPRLRGGLPDVPIVREHDDRLDSHPGAATVWEGIKNDFERWVRKIRVFCHPDLQSALFASTGSLKPDEARRDRLINLLTECAWTELQARR